MKDYGRGLIFPDTRHGLPDEPERDERAPECSLCFDRPGLVPCEWCSPIVEQEEAA